MQLNMVALETPIEIKKKIGERIRGLRQAKGLTVEQLIHESGIALLALVNIENGHYEMCFSEVFTIAKTLDMTVAQLLQEIC